MALTPNEAAILEFHDQGLSEGEIARIGFCPGSVHRTCSTFGSMARNAQADPRREAQVRSGSRQLLAAIRRARRAD